MIIFFDQINYTRSTPISYDVDSVYSSSLRHLSDYLTVIYGQTGRCQNAFKRITKLLTSSKELESIMWKNLPDVLANSLPIELRKIVGEYLDYPQQAKQ